MSKNKDISRRSFLKNSLAGAGAAALIPAATIGFVESASAGVAPSTLATMAAALNVASKKQQKVRRRRIKRRRRTQHTATPRAAYLPKGSRMTLSRAHFFTDDGIKKHIERDVRGRDPANPAVAGKDTSAFLELDSNFAPIATGTNDQASKMPLHKIKTWFPNKDQDRAFAHHLMCPGLILYFKRGVKTQETREPAGSDFDGNRFYFKPKQYLGCELVIEKRDQQGDPTNVMDTIQERLQARLVQKNAGQDPGDLDFKLQKAGVYIVSKYRPQLHWARIHPRIWHPDHMRGALNYYKVKWANHFAIYAP